jgi:hypothetical protein
MVAKVLTEVPVNGEFSPIKEDVNVGECGTGL